MAKIAQLIEAGDYLVYKGDWITGNEYHEKDIVTWADDGHLYEVIKAHTSSATLNPGNTEYYKAMTARKVISREFSTGSEFYQFVNTINQEQIKYLKITASGAGYRLIAQTLTDYSSTVISANDGSIRHTLLKVKSNSVTGFFLDVGINGARTKTNFSVQKYIIYYEE